MHVGRLGRYDLGDSPWPLGRNDTHAVDAISDLELKADAIRHRGIGLDRSETSGERRDAGRPEAESGETTTEERARGGEEIARWSTTRCEWRRQEHQPATGDRRREANQTSASDESEPAAKRPPSPAHTEEEACRSLVARLASGVHPTPFEAAAKVIASQPLQEIRIRPFAK